MVKNRKTYEAQHFSLFYRFKWGIDIFLGRNTARLPYRSPDGDGEGMGKTPPLSPPRPLKLPLNLKF